MRVIRVFARLAGLRPSVRSPSTAHGARRRPLPPDASGAPLTGFVDEAGPPAAAYLRYDGLCGLLVPADAA